MSPKEKKGCTLHKKGGIIIRSKRSRGTGTSKDALPRLPEFPEMHPIKSRNTLGGDRLGQDA